MAGAAGPFRGNRRAHRRPASRRSARPAAAHGRGCQRPASTPSSASRRASALVAGRGKCLNSQSQCATTQSRSALAVASAAKSSRARSSSMVTRPANSAAACVAPFGECREGDAEPVEVDGPRQPVVGRPDGCDAQRRERTPRLGKAVDALVEHVVVGERKHQPVTADARRVERVGQERGGHRMARARCSTERSAGALDHRAFAIADHQVGRGDQRPQRARRPPAPCGSRPPKCRR